ncbi:MAG TPA: SMI1/KNR4 family protein [Methylomirabilota bacterium]|jgi:cell wall assembly regulator SMI1
MVKKHMATGALREKLARLYSWAIELDKIEEPSPQDRTRPLPPASESEIAAAERRLRLTFPPSYRAFLMLHNGWKNFSFDWWLMSVSKGGTPAADREWTRDAASFEKDCRKRSPTTIESLRSQSKRDAAVMYWPDHVPLAADFNGGFLVFDRNRCRSDGEYEIVEIRDEEVDRRLPDFTAFVDWALSVARRELQIHQRDPDAIPSVSPVSTAPVRKTRPTSRKVGGKAPKRRRR